MPYNCCNQLILAQNALPFHARFSSHHPTFASSSFSPSYLYILTAGQGAKTSLYSSDARILALRENDCHPFSQCHEKGSTHDAYVAHKKPATFTMPPKAPTRSTTKLQNGKTREKTIQTHCPPKRKNPHSKIHLARFNMGDKNQAVLPSQSGMLRPSFSFRSMVNNPHLSSHCSSLVLNLIFHGSSKASNLEDCQLSLEMLDSTS